MDKATKQIVDEMFDYFSKFEGFNDNSYVFPALETYGFSKPIGGHTPTRWMNRLTKYNGFQTLDFHSLRHSHVCYLATEVALTPYQIADRIGDTVGVVLEHYYQFFQESRRQVVDQISDHENEFLSAMLGEQDKKYR